MKDKILIGWAVRNVTPGKPVNLSGQFDTRITDKIRDPVIVTALAVSNKSGNHTNSFIWVGCDSLAIPDQVLKLSRKIIGEKMSDFPLKNLILNATHTHTAPDNGIGWYPYLPEGVFASDEYASFLADQIAEASMESWKNIRPGFVAWGMSYVPIGHGRRSIYFDDLSKRQGAVETPGVKTEKNTRMYGDTSDDKFDRIESYADHSAHFLFTFDSKKRLTGAIINIACTAQETEHLSEISADFWYETRIGIRKKHGNIFILPQCSAAGDLSPHLMFNKTAYNRMLKLKGISSRQAIADRITMAFNETYPYAYKELYDSVELKHIVRNIKLPRRKITRAEYLKVKHWLEILEKEFKSKNSQEFLSQNSALYSRMKRCERVMERYENKGTLFDYNMELHVIRLGDIALATNPFELFSDYGIRIQARSPALQTFVVQLAGSGGYLPTRLAQKGEGYSACMFCNEVGPEGGDILVNETVNEIKNMWNTK